MSTQKPGFIMLLIMILSNISFAQNFNWITPNKTYLKMYVADDGLYRITKSDFTSAGINTSGIDPRTIKVYSMGTEIPIYFFGEQDGVFGDNDYFDFYGIRKYGGTTNFRESNNQVLYTTNEYYDLYSDTNCYWTGWDGSIGLRYLSSDFSTTNLFPQEYFYETVHFEKDKIYSMGENISASDYRFLNTERIRGESWYWALVSRNQSISDTLSTPSLSTTPQNATMRVFAYPQNYSTTIFNEHKIEVIVNGNIVSTLFTNDFRRIDTTVNFSSSFLSAPSVNNIELKYVPDTAFSGLMFMDLFELKYPKLFQLENHKLSATINMADTTSKLFRVSGFTSLNPVNIFDVVNNFRVINYTSNGDTLKFTGKSNAKFEIVNEIITKKPFRIKQRQVPNLVSNTNGADYLVIYNSLFTSQAEQLRTFRETHDNYRSSKAEIEDIYDIFNFGQENPVAIRNFVKYIYDAWQLPKIKFICLMGRASLDPKRTNPSSVYYQNYVPSYGNPNSDGYFANLKFGTFYYNDDISIGRLPAYYPSEAQTMVDKIIAYENEPIAKWAKAFTYITGGGTLNEQISHQQRSNFEIDQYIKPCPLAGDAHKIYRTDSSGHVTFNYADSIRRDIDNGTLFVNFRGHAGSHDWEVGMRDPNVLNNGNKLPLVVSLTCFTGENSKADYRGFGERFVYLANKGAIGFVGTTGWSYSFDGNNFGTYLIQSLQTDSTRRMGDLIKAVGKKMINDSSSFSVRHTVNCYNLIGDPAVKLKLPKIPEFEIKNNDYTLSDESIELNTPVTLTIFPKNYGLCADTCVVRFQLKRYNQNYSFRDTVYRNFKYEDTIKHNFSIDSIGVFKMVVTLDQSNRHPLEDKSNNTITIDIPVASTSFIPISPVNNTIVFKDSIELLCLNPNFTLNDKTVKVTLELDTTKLFNSPVKKTFVNNNPSGGVTKFRSAAPVNINNTVYYWRSNSVINNDTSGWSKTQIFIYNNGQQSADNKEEDRLSSSFSPVILFKNNPNQFLQPDLVNTKFDNEGIKLIEYPANLFVRSYGSNAEESSYFSVGDKSIYIDAGKNTGLNMLKVRKLTGSIVEFKNVRMTVTSTSSDSVISFLNTFDSTHYLMLLNASFVPGGRPLSVTAKTKLRQFGSVYCDSVANIGYFHTWSLIGFLGANHSQVSESFDPCCRPIVPVPCFECDHWTESVSNMTVIFKKPSGSVSNIVGPAQTWTDLSWNQSVFPFSNLVFDIIGIDISGQQTILMSDIQSNKFVNLSSINANQYPRLNLLGKFTIDSLAGLNSPVLNAVTVNYTPASELVLDRNSLQLNPSSKDNSVSDFSFDYQNAGYSYIYGLIVNVTLGENLLLTDTINSILKIDSTKNYSNSFTLPQFRDSANIVFHIKPKQSVNEFYTFNNFGEYTVKSTEASIATTFSLEVLSDGRVLNNGDYVRKTPELKINVLKNISESLLSDTSQLSIRLNDIYIPYYVNGSLNRMLKALDKDNSRGENSISVNFYPELNTGENKLSVSYKDELGNSDTMSVDVIVSDELFVKDFYNYPNPMRGETSFIFNLAGSAPPAGFKIKLYTVSGRLIRELEAPVSIGYNQIPWDGKDSDGDFVANGTYLYKLIAEDDSKVESQIQKLVVLR